MRNTVIFSAFQILFFTVMWASKTLHPIFFEESGSLANFGLSYSAMALAGYFSFLTGSFTDRMGVGKTLGIGSMLYAIGIFFRVYPDSEILAVTSGLLAGLGASITMLAARMWMLQLATTDTQSRWVGIKSSTTALGTALGCALAGLLPTMAFLALSLKDILMLVAGLLFAVGAVICVFAFSKDQQMQAAGKKSPLADLKLIFSKYRRLAIFTSVIGIMTGFYVSFVSPYLPLIMKEKGLSMSSIGLSIGAFSLLRFFVDPLIARWIEKRKSNTLKIFLFAEFFILLVTGFFAFTVSQEVFIGLLLIRSLSLGFSAISEELIWIQSFPREMVGLLFGLNQTSFFMGDFIGGLLNGILYQKYGLPICVAMAVVAIIINSYLFVALFRSKQTIVKLAEASA